jgi:hypothetical protein
VFFVRRFIERKTGKTVAILDQLKQGKIWVSS